MATKIVLTADTAYELGLIENSFDLLLSHGGIKYTKAWRITDDTGLALPRDKQGKYTQTYDVEDRKPEKARLGRGG